MHHFLLSIFHIVQPVVPALHSFGCGVGDALSAFHPMYLVSFTFHQGNKLLSGERIPHTLVDGIHEAKLPAFSLDGGTVLPTVHSVCSFGLRFRQNRKAMFAAEFVR